jgi:hypothetical protein
MKTDSTGQNLSSKRIIRENSRKLSGGDELKKCAGYSLMTASR